MMQGWYYVKNLTGQRHDRVQTESKQLQPWTAVSTSLALDRQHGVASYEIFSCSTDIHMLTKMMMTSDETQIQIPANWPMSQAKRVTRDNWKNPEYHVVAAIR